MRIYIKSVLIVINKLVKFPVLLFGISTCVSNDGALIRVPSPAGRKAPSNERVNYFWDLRAEKSRKK